MNITGLRIRNQHLAGTSIETPEAMVRALGAVQSQDYPGGKWGLGLRMPGLTDDVVEDAFTAGRILRTHVMRPTWHFVAPEDIRWLLALTAPRVNTASGSIYRRYGLDAAAFKRSSAVIAKALRGGKHLTREELRGHLERAGIEITETTHMACYMMHAELDGLICSGPRRGKQFTYALVDERVPKAKALTRDEALVELTRRYFRTRGPATLHDYAWWSGLSMADVRKGVAELGSELVEETVAGRSFWLAADFATPAKEPSPTAHLLPNYDEYFIGFRDRSDIAESAPPKVALEHGGALAAHILIVDGMTVGGWNRAVKPNEAVIELKLLRPLSKREARAVDAAARRYEAFLGIPVRLA